MSRIDPTFATEDDDWETISIREDRRYGLWSPSLARQWGYGIPPGAETNSSSGVGTIDEDEWLTAWLTCNQSTDQLSTMDPNMALGDTSPSVVAQGTYVAYFDTIRSTRFQLIRAEWEACIEASDAVPDDNSDIMMPVVPADEREAKRVAIVDTTCKEQNDSIRRAANLEAEFQAVYIDEHRDQLEDYRRQADRVLNEARTIVADAGQ